MLLEFQSYRGWASGALGGALQHRSEQPAVRSAQDGGQLTRDLWPGNVDEFCFSVCM